MLKLEIY